MLRELAEVRNALRAAGVKPVPEFPRVGGVEPRELYLKPDEFAGLLACVTERNWPKDWPTRRDYLLVWRALGLSYSELYRLDEIDFAREIVRVRGTKRESRRRTVPMGQARDVLQRAAHLRDMRGDGQLFPVWDNMRVNDYLTAAAERAGVVQPGTRVSINVLRASFCTELVLAGVAPSQIAKLMGHRTTRTAERWYTRLRPETDLHDAVARQERYDLSDATSQLQRPNARRTISRQ